MRVKEGKPCGLSLGNIQCRTRSGEGSVPRGCHERDGQGSKAVPGRERKQKIKVEHFPELVKCTNPQVQNSCDPPPRPGQMHNDASQDPQTTGGTFQRGQRAEGRQSSRGQLPTNGRTDIPTPTGGQGPRRWHLCVCGGGEEPPATPLRSENTLHSGAKEDVSEKREVL